MPIVHLERSARAQRNDIVRAAAQFSSWTRGTTPRGGGENRTRSTGALSPPARYRRPAPPTRVPWIATRLKSSRGCSSWVSLSRPPCRPPCRHHHAPATTCACACACTCPCAWLDLIGLTERSFGLLDSDGSGSLDWGEFATLVRERLGMRMREHKLQSLWLAFDVNEDGCGLLTHNPRCCSPQVAATQRTLFAGGSARLSFRGSSAGAVPVTATPSQRKQRRQSLSRWRSG